MAVTFNGVDVPQQLVKLDCVGVTTGFGAVLRQVVAVADPELPNQILRIDADGAVAITTAAPLDVTLASLPLPLGAATNALQTAGNAILESIDTAIAALPTDQALTDTQLRATPVDVAITGQPIGTEQGSIDVLRGSYPDRAFSKKFGFSGAVATVDETIWSLGSTLYPYLAAARTLTVSSSSALDTAIGTGARTVLISGLNASYNEISETVTLSGVAPVTTANSYLRINRAWVLTAGSGGENAGAIYVGYGTVTAGVPANTLAQIAIAANQAAFSVYTVPAGFTAYLVAIQYGSGALTGAGTPNFFELSTWVRAFGGVFRNRGRIPIAANSSGTLNYQLALTVTEKSDFDLRARANAGTGSVGVSYDMILVEN